MTADILLSLIVFAAVTAFTPGPNNTMLLASGVTYGFRATLPHIGGITLGYLVMFAAVAIGVERFSAQLPKWYAVLRFASAFYLIWLALRIATAPVSDGAAPGRRPMTFMQAALFQWINPKGVAIALALATNYIRPNEMATDLPVVSVVVFLVSFASASAWALFGQSIRGVLSSELRRRAFNWTMAAALLASLWTLMAPLALRS